MQGQTPPPSQYQNPKLHSDLLALYTRFFSVHKNMAKYLRISILEQEVLGAISAMMRITIHINVMKARQQAAPAKAELLNKLYELRGYVENLKAFTTLLWNTKAISDGFFLDVMSDIEAIAKQIAGWQKFLSK